MQVQVEVCTCLPVKECLWVIVRESTVIDGHGPFEHHCCNHTGWRKPRDCTDLSNTMPAISTRALMIKKALSSRL